MPFVLAALLLSACSIDTHAIAPGVGADGSVPDGNVTDGWMDTMGPLDAEVRDTAPPRDDTAPPDTRVVDSGPPMPTPIVTAASSGGYEGHPTVIWSGTRFDVAVISVASGGGHVETYGMLPGDVTPIDRRRASSGGARDRRGTVLASAPDGRLAVGWHEYDGAEWDVVVAIDSGGSFTERRFDGAAAASDHNSLALFWVGSELRGVVRQAGAGGSHNARDVRFDPGPVAIDIAPFAAAPDLGGMDGIGGPDGPVVVFGATGATFHRTTAFVTIDSVAALSPVEADVAILDDESIFSVWSADASGERAVYARRLDRSGSAYVPAFGPRLLSWRGPDPTIAAASAGPVGAYIDESGGERIVTVVALDADGAEIGGPCPLANLLPSANDPVIACGGGYCAVVWLEGSTRSDTDFVTRVVQLPISPALMCP